MYRFQWLRILFVQTIFNTNLIKFTFLCTAIGTEFQRNIDTKINWCSNSLFPFLDFVPFQPMRQPKMASLNSEILKSLTIGTKNEYTFIEGVWCSISYLLEHHFESKHFSSMQLSWRSIKNDTLFCEIINSTILQRGWDSLWVNCRHECECVAFVN